MPPEALDFTCRTDPSTLPELMDEPCTYEQFRACIRDLEKVNRLTLSYRPTIAFLNRVLSTHLTKPIRILDIGFGYGDTLRYIHRWAAQRNLKVELTGIDLNPYAERATREANPSLPIEWLTGNAFTYNQPADLILSSLLTHHLPHAELLHFLRWSEQTATTGWFINDLERQPAPAKLFAALAKIMRWHPFVQHDGPVSFHRAFRTADWQALLIEAGIPNARILPTFPARLCVERLKVDRLK